MRGGVSARRLGVFEDGRSGKRGALQIGALSETDGASVDYPALCASIEKNGSAGTNLALNRSIQDDMLAHHITSYNRALGNMHQAVGTRDIAIDQANAGEAMVADDVAMDGKARLEKAEIWNRAHTVPSPSE